MPRTPDDYAADHPADHGAVHGAAARPVRVTGDVAPGTQIAHYRLLRFIARGGMGQVWEAFDEQLRTMVALKLVAPERLESEALRQVTREARAGGRLRHPNVVATLGFGVDGTRAWIAQELVPGAQTLADMLTELRHAGEAPRDHVRWTAELVARMGDALNAAHLAGVIHRDVKPANILIADDETPKLTDFGLAQLVDSSVVSREGELAGTLSYMSPEQVTAKRIGLDHRTDVFSLGVVLYELLTLRRPFEGDTTAQIAESVLYHEPPSPALLSPRCPGELAAICGKAMEKLARDRYATAAEFAADLRRHLADEPVHAQPPGVLRRGVKWCRRHPTWAAVLLLGTIALSTTSALGMHAWRTARALTATNRALVEQRDAAERSAYIALFTGAAAAFERGAAAEARAQFDACPTPLRRWEWHYLADELDGGATVLDAQAGPVLGVDWAPDGELVAAAYDDGRVRIWDVARGAIVFEFDVRGEAVTRVAWSQTGGPLATGSSDGYVRLWDPHDWRLIDEFKFVRGQRIDALRWSRDGERLAASGGCEPISVWHVADLEARIDLVRAHGCAHSLSWSSDSVHLASGSAYPGASEVVVWDVTNGAVVAETERIEAPIVWDPTTGQIVGCLATNGVGATSVLANWNPASGAVGEDQGGLRALALGLGYRDPVCWMEGKFACMALGSEAGTVQLEWPDGSSRALRGHAGAVRDLAWNDRAGRLATGGMDGTVRVWDPSRVPYRHVHGTKLTWSSDGERFAIARVDEEARDVLIGTSSPDRELCDATYSVALVSTLDDDGEVVLAGAQAAAWSPNGTRVVTDRGRIYDSATGEVLLQLDERARAGSLGEALAWSNDGRWIALSEGRSRPPEYRHFDVTVASAVDGAIAHILVVPLPEASAGPSTRAVDLQFIGSGADLVVEHWHRFDAATGRRLGAPGVAAVGEGLIPLRWDGSGRYLALGAKRGELVLWDATLSRRVWTADSRGSVPEAACWSADGERLVVGRDLTAEVYDTGTGTRMLTLDHVFRISRLRWSPCSRWIALDNERYTTLYGRP